MVHSRVVMRGPLMLASTDVIITELLPIRARKRVAWFQSDPPSDGLRAFTERGFVVDTIRGEDVGVPADLAGVAAVVFIQSLTKLTQIGHSLAAHARLLLDCDCRIIVRPAPIEQALSVFQRIVAELGLDVASPTDMSLPALPHIRVCDVATPWADIANYVTENPPGPAPRSNDELEISVVNERGEAVSLEASRDILLRRAFSDCSKVHLVPMDEPGKSGAIAYRAYADLANPEHGRWPVAYFVKLGSKDKILQEYTNYLKYVAPYIPFHLGPHLVRERCCLGASQGVIVGDYVDESEDLISCAPGGRSAAAISCLFDRTLHGWYRDPKTIDMSIAATLHLPGQINPSRINRAYELGATLNLDDLQELFQRCTSVPVLFGGAHGDLHARNIRVRATDAIVIDFFAHRVCPLVCDAASLEASLLVDGFSGDRRDARDLLASIETLYAKAPLEPGLPHANPRNPSAWFFRAVRQIRLHAQQMESGANQYAGALAVALLAKAKKDPTAAEPAASHRAMAYVVAERVLVASFGPLAASIVA